MSPAIMARMTTAAQPPRAQPSLVLSATFLAVLLAVVRVALVVALPYQQAVGLFDDDAYYYFGVAKHIAGGDGSTFNGLDLTNGYHPLWLGVLVPVFALTEGRGALIAVAVVSSVLFIASARLLDKLGSVLGAPLAVTLSSAPLLMLGATGPSFWFSGMETGLLLLGLLALAVLFVRTNGFRSPSLTWQWAFGLGGVLAATVLARLDAIFIVLLVAVLAVLAWRHWGQRQMLHRALALAVVPTLGLGGYLLFNQLAFGTALPVSGQAKALGGPAGAETFSQFVEFPILAGQPLWMGAFALVAVPAAVVLAGRAGALAQSARMGLVTLVGGMLTVGYYTATSPWHLYPWYFYATPLALALAGPALIERLRVANSVLMIVTAAACIVALGAVGGRAMWVVERGADQYGLVEQASLAAARVADLAPPAAPLAMGDGAGAFGYHLGRPLVHLEGLVNSAEYLDALRAGRVTRFLNERQVRFFARVEPDTGTPNPAAGPGCSAYLEPIRGGGPKVPITVCASDLLFQLPSADGYVLRVWRYRPELNP